MDADPSRNLVVFELRRGGGQRALAEVPTRDDDGLRQAWEQVRREHDATAAEVSSLYSEWEPSADDVRFVRETFAGADMSYSFERPGPDGWGAALEGARHAMVEAAHEQAGRAAAEGMREVGENGELLPVLWSHGSPRSGMLEFLPHVDVVPGQLCYSLATVGPTSRGTIGMSHVTESGLSGRPFNDLVAEAFGALAGGLQVNCYNDDANPERVTLLRLDREGSFASSAVAMPDFHERMSELLGEDDLLVGLPEPDTLVVTGARSSWADDVRRMVLESPCPATELIPTLLRLNRSGMTVEAQRQSV
ncbi:hypothetical protein [Phytohabitans aurantiacus]|uniref:YcaO domain-containing protein n=1 Tax=Phytohabitans aurantiacus TaxID=3016789 RepID=A0ABQ5R1Y8_9ACTN|nr:hypothetical protein [Phytohabitans aurantiacus]GLI00812.1 hypothetical protein Pa4123_60880 [Phytohabitans aurantiacus]